MSVIKLQLREKINDLIGGVLIDKSYFALLRNSFRHKTMQTFAAIAGYAVIAVVFFRPLMAKISNQILADDFLTRPGLSDAYSALWSYWWTLKAVATGQNILFCNWVWPPTGADLHFHSTTILPAILTAPFAWVFGMVAGFNIMVLLLIVFGAFSCYLMLRSVFGISGLSAFVAGALFGFAPYFVFKAHAHINLIGSVFWVNAIAFQLKYYLHHTKPLNCGLLFALFAWATFWTSLVEFYMLSVMVAVIAIAFESSKLLEGRFKIWGSTKFYVPSLAGAVSLLAYWGGGGAKFTRPCTSGI